MREEFKNFTFKFFSGEIYYYDELWHYTSPDGFNSILTQDKKYITFRASRIDCLNDITEGVYVIDVYKRVCKEMYDNKEITEEQYDIIKALKPSSERFIMCQSADLCDNTKNKSTEYASTTISKHDCKIYVACFSEDKDSLPLWNYYVKNNKYNGFNLGMVACELSDDLSKFYGKGIQTKIKAVVYDINEQKKQIKDFLVQLLEFYGEVETASIEYLIVFFLNNCSICYKNSCFSHEKEVRIIVEVADASNELKEKYDVSSTLIKPYIELKFEKEHMHRVSVGPLQITATEKENQASIIKEFLNKNGYNNVDVTHSEIPIRY